MKVQLLGLFASGLLCGCAANTPYSETVVDTKSTLNKEDCLRHRCTTDQSIRRERSDRHRTRKPLLTRFHGRTCDRFRGSTVSPS